MEYRPEKRNSVLICRQYFLPFFFIVFIADHQNLSLQTPSKRTSQPFASVRRKKKEVEENRKEKKRSSVFFLCSSVLSFDSKTITRKKKNTHTENPKIETKGNTLEVKRQQLQMCTVQTRSVYTIC